MGTNDKKDSFPIKEVKWGAQREVLIFEFLVGILFFVVVIPYVIDRIFAYRVYRLWEYGMIVPSPMGEGEWFAFLGSYAGAVGTIIMGMVAYVQSKTINDNASAMQKLQQQVLEMQREVNGFQLNPVIRIEQATISAKMSADSVEQEKIKKELERLCFSIYGEEIELENDEYKYVEIRGLLKNAGIVPIVQCSITDITWKLGKIYYRFNIERNVIETGSGLNIIIGDDIKCMEGDERKLWEDIYQHTYNKTNGFIGYDKSVLTITCRFKTQYDAEYGKEWEQLPGYEIVCIITSEENQLKINNFHMHRMGEKNGNK